MKKNFIFICIILLVTAGCSGISGAIGKNKKTEMPKPTVKQRTMHINYPVRESLDVRVTFENQRAYDAVQLGLSLLDQGKEMGDVPSIEDPEFFPDYFTLVNVDISDGLLLISEEEAANFARETFLEYQKKIVPADYLRSMRKHRIVQEILSTQTDS